MHYLKKKKFVIACDTRICKSIENIVREEWGGICIFNSFSSQSRGVAIFLKKNSTAKIADNFTDPDGNILSILVKFQEKKKNSFRRAVWPQYRLKLLFKKNS